MIFNKLGKGNEEVKTCIGFIYKNISFENLKPYIELAEEDIKRIISEGVFKTANDFYNSSDYDTPTTEEEKLLNIELVKKTQLVVAMGAYRVFVNSNDLSHGSAGRQINVGAEMKPAFSWQIKQDNQNLADIYYKYIDLLLSFLDKNKTTDFGKEWRECDEFSTTKNLLISNAESFDKYFKINQSRHLFITLAPHCKRIQEQQFKAVLKIELYQKLIDALHEKQGVTLSEEEEEILELCKLPLALFTMSEGLKLLNTELLPDRVANNYYATTTEGNSQKNPSGNERFAAAAALETRARSEMRRLQIAVAKYYATINGTTPEPIKLSNTNYHRKIVSF